MADSHSMIISCSLFHVSNIKVSSYLKPITGYLVFRQLTSLFKLTHRKLQPAKNHLSL